MSGTVQNDMGTITISENAIAMIAGRAAVENYGLADMSAKSTSEEVLGFIRFITGDSKKRGVKVTAVDDETFDIDLFVKLNYGLSLNAVAQNIISHVRYRTESMTGMKIRDVNIHVEGIYVEKEEV